MLSGHSNLSKTAPPAQIENRMRKYIMALDQGTTSSKVVIFDKECKIMGLSHNDIEQSFPFPNWVEHNPEKIWESQLSAIHSAMSKSGISWQEIESIGITNQRETTVIWDRKTSLPIYNAIVWQDKRTSAYCDWLKAQGFTDYIREKTGLVVDAYFSATKIKWILDNVPDAHSKAENGELCFGTIDSWLLWKLSGGKCHATDVSNASRTMLFNINTLEWDADLLRLFDIPASILPSVEDSCHDYCFTNIKEIPHPIPVCGVAGDQQAALFGQLCLEEFTSKATYGTGCFVMMNTGSSPHFSTNGMLTTIGWKIGNNVTYALEGSVFIGGAIIQWLRDGIGIIDHAAQSEDLARLVEDNGGVYFVPALTGLGAPHWDQYARGMIIGITRATTSAHISRAALEAIAFQVDDVIKAMQQDVASEIKSVKVDGGAVANDFLMQFQADLLGVDVIRPQIMESTAFGAAMFAGLASGFWKSVEQIKKYVKADRVFSPDAESSVIKRMKEKWKDAVGRSKNWSN